MDLKVSVVLPAAGSGERMGVSTPKQFCKVRGKEIIMHTIDAFSRIPWIEHIIVPTSAERKGQITELCQKEPKVKIVLGASVRHRSIWNGVKAVEQVQKDCDVVVIHDGVRPLIEESLLIQVVNAAYHHGAAGVVRPLVSTIVATDGEGFLEESLDRCRYRASEMPQAFRYHHIATAYQRCTDYDLDYGTECLHLAMKYAGSKVKLIEGPDYLWKVTHKKDLFALQSVLQEKEQHYVSLLGFDDESTLCKILNESLQTSQIQLSPLENSKETTGIIHLSEKHSLDSWVGYCDGLLCDQVYGCIVCVMTGSSDTSKQKRLPNVLKHLQSSWNNALVHGIVIQDDAPAKLSDILQYLILGRNVILSGQILAVHT